MRTVTPEAVRFIKTTESFSAKKYVCPAGKPTIGYGHVLLPSERMTFVTELEATDIFLSDLHKTERALGAKLDGIGTEGQFDALVSLAFNYGVSRTVASTAVKRLKAGNDDETAASALLFINMGGGTILPGLITRRAQEAQRFLGLSFYYRRRSIPNIKTTGEALAIITSLLRVKTPGNQRAALLSYVKELPQGAFEAGTVRESLNVGDDKGAVNAMIADHLVSGRVSHDLILRRSEQAVLFLKK